MAIFKLELGLVFLVFLCLGTFDICAAQNHRPKIKLGVGPSARDGVMTAREDTPVNSYLAIAEVADEDEGEAGRVDCAMDNKYAGIERLQQSIYKIELNSPLDREMDALVEISIRCFDHGNPPYTATATFSIAVQDANDNAPVFTSELMTAKVGENAPLGSFVARVLAIDRDEGINAKISYSLDAMEGESLPFMINGDTGDITTKEVLDREAVAEYNLTVVARDMGQPPHTGIATVNVVVKDMNDNSPIITSEVIHARENEPAMVKIGQLQGKDEDTGINAQLSFSKKENSDSSSTAPFLILPNGDILAVVTLDREQRDQYELTAMVTDKGKPSLSSTSTILIHVDDVNDNYPVIITPCLENEDLAFVMDSGNNVTSLLNSSGFIAIDWYTPDDARVVYRAKAEDADAGENARLSYFIESVYIPNDGLNSSSNSKNKKSDDPLFKIDESTGEVKLRRIVQSEEELVQLLNITVMDNGQPALSAHCFINVIIDVKMVEITTPTTTNTHIVGDPRNAAPRSQAQPCKTVMFTLLFSVILSALSRRRPS